MENIPKLKLENGKVVEETMTLQLEVNDKMEDIVLRKLSSGVQGRIRSVCTKTKFLNGQPQVDINDAELEVQLLQAALVTAPFPTDIETVKSLPSDVVSYIIGEWSEFISATPAKKD